MGLGFSEEVVNAMMNASRLEPARGKRLASVGLPVGINNSIPKTVNKNGLIVMPDGLLINEMDTYGKDSTNVDDMNKLITDKREEINNSSMSKYKKQKANKSLNKLNKIHLRVGDATNGGKKPNRMGWYRPSTNQVRISDLATKENQQYIADHEMGHAANAGSLNDFYHKPNSNVYERNLDEDIVRSFSIRKNLPSKYKNTGNEDFIHPMLVYNTNSNEFNNMAKGYKNASKERNIKHSGGTDQKQSYYRNLDKQRLRLSTRLLDDPAFAQDMINAYSNQNVKFQAAQIAANKKNQVKRYKDHFGMDYKVDQTINR